MFDWVVVQYTQFVLIVYALNGIQIHGSLEWTVGWKAMNLNISAIL